jgi:hypothetical protein
MVREIRFQVSQQRNCGFFAHVTLEKQVPPQGSSMEGESGLKIRPKGVVDGQQVNIPLLCVGVAIHWITTSQTNIMKAKLTTP